MGSGGFGVLSNYVCVRVSDPSRVRDGESLIR